MSAIPRERVEGIHALSPVQHGIFLHALVEPELAPYVEQAIWRLQGAVAPELVERAWNELTARHAILRTVFRQARRQPVQIVLTERSIDVPCHDWTPLSAEAQRHALAGLAESERAPFNLGDGPLFRLALVRLSPDEWRLVWTFHHLILDGLSVALLLHAFAAIYDALAAREPLPAPGAPPFSRFVAWLSRQDRDEALRVWAARLDGFVTPTPIPADRLPAGAPARTHRACHIRLGADTTRALADAARYRQVTVATLIQAAWALLIARYSGEPDVAFGLTLAGRPADLPDVERIAGPFINTVPMRLSLAGDPRLSDLLQAIQQARFDLDRHGYLSVADIQGRSAIRAPAALVDTALNVHPRIDWRGFRSKSFALGVSGDDGPIVERTNYDVMVDVGFLDAMIITISYVQEQFDRSTIEALLAGMRTLLEGIASGDPDRRVSALSGLAPGARTRLLDDFNRTEPPVAFEGGAVSRIEARAAERPGATSVIADGTRLSYGTLNARANQVAWWLRAAGVGREDRVAVFGERGAGWLTFVLGVLKAGAAFVPLDPLQPDARLEAIVSACRPSVLACGPESAARGLALASAVAEPPPVVCWGDAPPGVAIGDATLWAGRSPANPPRATAPHDLACVFFTSGSTGVPKGVMVEHAGVLNHLAAKVAHLGIDASSVVAQNASIGFDISVWQMLAALTVGGSVAIYPDEIAFDQARLVAGLSRDGVTILETVPSLMDALMDAASAAGVPTLTSLVSNAELLPVPLCRRWLERFPHIPLMNTYGPTECSDDNTHYWQREAPPGDTIRIPIGPPIPGARIYVIDRAGEPAPMGAPGELALGGITVGRGYLGDPVKTALAFVPDPFSPEAGSRMYLSGDIGRWTGAGVLEWLRRDGDQVKVRGHRIELGEIQATMLRHPGVRQAAAIVRQHAEREPQIVAYWVGENAVDTTALRDRLTAALPRYMLPSAIVRLDAFPVTSNGKLDRRALPAPPEEQPATTHVEPGDPIEAAIAAIWCEVLGLDRVGATDNFYEAGGQSLRTMQIRSRLGERFGVDLPLRAIFRNQTVRGQARLVAEALAERAPRVAAIPRMPDAGAYALSHAQQRLWIMHELDPADTSYNLLAPLSIVGPLDLAALDRAWPALVARQASLRTIFDKVSGEPVQRILPPVSHPLLQHVDVSALPEPEGKRRLDEILADARRTPFTLDTPPVRALVVTLAPERHLLALAVHHLVSDGWSGEVILSDLLELYRAARDGVEPRLAPMPIRYVDYAAWQNERFAAGGFAESERYWMTQLSGELPALDLPAARTASPPVSPGDAHTLTFSIDPETAERLGGATADREVTPFMLRLALVKTWLAHFTGADDLLVGSPVAGRDRPETEPLVGFFVNLLALRTSLAGDPSFPDVVDRVKRSCLEGYAHQEYPYDELVRRLKPRRQAARAPIFDVLFLTARMGAPRTAGGLTIAVAPGARERATMTFAGAQVAALVACIEQPDGGLWWTLSFDAQRIDRDVAEQAAARCEAIVREVARRPRARLSALGAFADSRTDIPPPRRAAGRDEAPLSLAQRDVWDRCERAGRGSLGAAAVRAALDGPLDTHRFLEAVQGAARRHEAFRLTFGARDGVPVQRVGPMADIPVAVHDLTALDPATQADRADALERELACTAFDVGVAPLARAALVRLAGDRHVVILSWHQLIADGWHIAGLFDEVGQTYAGREDAGSRTMGAADIAVWQQERLRSGRLVREANYWRAELQRTGEEAVLPADRPLPAKRTFETAAVVHTIPPEVALPLRALARACRTTPLRVIVAAASAWSARLAHERRVALAVPMAARPRGARGAVGSFVHHVPMSVPVGGEQSFAALVACVTARLSRAHRCREYAAALDPADPGASARPAVTMAVTGARMLDRTYGAIRMRTGAPIAARSPYDFALTVVDGAGTLALHVAYATDAFEASTIHRWGEHLLSGLARAVARPEVQVDCLDFVPARERAWLVRDLNATTTAYPATSVHRLFETQAAARPDAEALRGGGRAWSYGALNCDANRLARRLVALGARPGAIVATFLDRSPELVVAIVAILKAGAAYLPLDADEAAERLGVMLEDAGSPLVVTTSAQEGRLPAALASRCVALDRDAAAIAGEDGGNLLYDGDGGSLAYVMYTSGSTGRPKGVMIPHRGVVRLVCETNYAAFGPGDRVAHMGKCSFDASTIEIWGALLNGGALVTIAHDTMLSPAALSESLAGEGITVAFATPAFFQYIAREAPGCFSRVKTLLVGGDVLSPAAARRILEVGPPERLVNIYGPTENSSVSTYHLVDRAAAASASIPIGRPISNTEVYVVDAELRPVGVGAPGELWTGGAGVADGYFGRPALTAETFVPDPFSGRPGARVYRTGDVASWRADGAIQFHGRSDHQVKIRGHRIELGEVEAVLLQHETVAEAVVTARENAAGDKQLAAYVVAAPGAAVAADALRRHAGARLPAYMVPAWIVPLASLPLGRTGKVDRKALPEPEHGRTAAGVALVPPRTAIEAEIARVWREILGVNAVGIADNFFDLGGDSLQCIVAVARLTERGIRTAPKTFYENPTIAGLAAHAERATAPTAEDEGPVSGAVPLLPVQRFFFEQDLPAAHHWNVGVLLRAEGLDAAAVERALQALLDHHDALRMRFTPGPDAWRQYNPGPGEPVCFEVIDLGGDRARLTAECERIQASLDLTRGPLFRAALFRLADGTDRLLLIEHHLVSDIASGRTIADDLTRAYEQAARGDAVDLGPRTTSYRRWAQLLEAHAPQRVAELPFWQSMVEPGWPAVPLDHDRGDNTIESIGHVRVELGAADTRALLAARQTRGLDLYEILLAALARVLGEWTGVESSGVLVHGHGRDGIAGVDLSRTVGWFTAMYPIRLETGRGASRAEHLDRTRTIAGSVPDGGLGYGLLRDLLRHPALAGRPYPDVTFNYRGRFVSVASDSRFSVAPESPGALIAARGRRSGLLNVDCVSMRGRLVAAFVYSRHKHRAETIDAVARRFAQELREIAAWCATAEPGRDACGDAASLEHAAAGV